MTRFSRAVLAFALALSLQGEQIWQSKNAEYRAGLGALEAQHWSDAIDAFSRAALRADDYSDGALYWKAYAQHRLGDRQAAMQTLWEFKRTYKTSRWQADANGLLDQLQAEAGNLPVSLAVPDQQETLVGLNRLLQSKPALALPPIRQIIAAPNSGATKNQALLVLAMNPSPETRATVFDLAQQSQDPVVRQGAIRYLGLMGGYGQLEKLYSGSASLDNKRQIVQSLVLQGKAEPIVAIVRSEPDPGLRAEALRSLSLLDVHPVAGELEVLYKADTHPEVKRAIVNALIFRRATATLTHLEPAADPPDRRRIRSFLQNTSPSSPDR